MAKVSTMTSASGAEKKKAVARGPLKRTFHFFCRITDAAGNPIPDAKLSVDRVMTDARKVVEFLDSDQYVGSGLVRVKHEVVSEPRTGSETDGATSVG